MIEIDGIKKTYKDFTLDCSLTIQPGTITGLLGQNGAGKTTLFEAIMDLIHVEKGKILIFGKDHQELDKNQVGFVLSNTCICEYLKLRELIQMLNAVYDHFHLDHFIEQCKAYHLPFDKKINEFSTGMKAKLNILIALSHEAKLLLLDEPTAGSDVVAREEILDLIRTFMEEDEERCVLISSHISSDLESLCDDIYMIDQGHIILHETNDCLLDEYGLLKVTKEQYQDLDLEYILKTKEENYGYACLSNHKQFYKENYPDIVIEKNTLDILFSMMLGGH